MGDILVLAVLVLAVTPAVRGLFRKKTGCCGNCSGCPGCGKGK